jgi:hypothetical protein
VRTRSTEASEDDESTEEDHDGPASTQPQRKSQRTKKGKAPIDESIDMDEDEENVTPEVSQKRRRSSKR